MTGKAEKVFAPKVCGVVRGDHKTRTLADGKELNRYYKNRRATRRYRTRHWPELKAAAHAHWVEKQLRQSGGTKV